MNLLRFIIKHYYEAIKEIWRLLSQVVGMIIGLAWGTLYVIAFLPFVILKEAFNKKEGSVK